MAQNQNFDSSMFLVRSVFESSSFRNKLFLAELIKSKKPPLIKLMCIIKGIYYQHVSGLLQFPDGLATDGQIQFC